MSAQNHTEAPAFGSPELRLPDELRGPLKAHIETLRQRYLEMGWGGRGGFGRRPALVVIDLALWWTKPDKPPMGSHVDPIVESTCTLLAAARRASIPIFFTTYDYDPADPPTPHERKCAPTITPEDAGLMALDPRLQRRPEERVIRKKYASAFKSTNLQENLTTLGVDTLIVTGVSTSHCIYATCRDAAHTFRVVVPRQAVGERCELLHEVNLLDIDIDLGDVMELGEVTGHLEALD